MTLHRFWEITRDTTLNLGLRYGLAAGIVWLLGYVIFKRQWLRRKIIAKFPNSADLRREIIYSALSVIIFSLVAAGTYFAVKQGWTQAYLRLAKHSPAWFWTSIVLAIFLHDAWFYWTHRLMHHPRLFRLCHRTHHLSHNPTPWAAYSFSPLEAFTQALIFPITLMLIPMHPYAFGLVMIWQIAFNIAGHSGFEIYPSWLMRTPLKYILNTPTNHVMHHETLRGNYGLYFNIWDRLMRTNNANYEARFLEVTRRRPAQTAATEPTPPAPFPQSREAT